jgi:hypothetical protein
MNHVGLGLHRYEQAQWDALCWRHSQACRAKLQHRTGAVEGFTKRYGLKMLVYAEPHDRIEQAIQSREDHQELDACAEGAVD